MRHYLTRLLSERYEVHAAADGLQALEVTRKSHGDGSGRAGDSDERAVHGREVEAGWREIRESGSVFTARSSTPAAAGHGVGR